MQEFPPSRQRGLVLHIVFSLALGAVGLVSFWLAFQTQVGLGFALYVLLFFFTAVPTPILAYRAYALVRANYLLDRNTLRLVWGLRVEDIPVSDVEWVRPASGLATPLALPFFRLPGSILGVKNQRDIGRVEFLAAEADTLLLVATAKQVFAISPADPGAFVTAFQKAIEMGSLAEVAPRSQYVTFVVARAWENLPARFFWLAGAFLNIGMLVWVTALAPSLPGISLGFTPEGAPLPPAPAAQLILLPLLSAVLFVADWLAGLFFYRRNDQHILSLVMWAAGAFTSLLFLLGVYFLVTTPV
ncbi:MAG: hypothetical protein EHM81_04215 [Chloroflexi bacterium]|nr:MAG: hypothetical protein EHM81_04215 [Chloroflexota bacterium]